MKKKDFPMENLRNVPENLLGWEKRQAKYNYDRGRRDGVREKDVWHAVLIWATFLGGLVIGFYYSTLYFAVKFCN